MKPDNNSTGRYLFIFIIICLAAIYILGTALQTMLSPQKDYWITVSKRFTTENLPIPANRGNLLASDGQLLAGSIPEFRLYMDYVVIDVDSSARMKAQHWRDSAFKHDLDSIALGLSKIFPDKNKKWFKSRLEEGKKRKSHAWRIYPKNATYIQLQECKKLPLLRETSLKGGFYTEEIIQRKKPFGSLASRTIGDLYRDSNGAKCGLELSFDSILRGKPGVGHSTKVRNRRIRFVDMEPQHGHDIVTTIDVNIQDAAEKAMRKMLTSLDGTEIGVAMVMEVATGDIKAIVNLMKSEKDGNFYEGNMRSATNEVTYILSGEEEVYKPTYTFQGFRYIHLVEYPFETVDLSCFTAIAVTLLFGGLHELSKELELLHGLLVFRVDAKLIENRIATLSLLFCHHTVDVLLGERFTFTIPFALTLARTRTAFFRAFLSALAAFASAVAALLTSLLF